MGTMHLRNLIYAYFGILLFLCEITKHTKHEVKNKLYGTIAFTILAGSITFIWIGISSAVFDYKQEDDLYSPVKASQPILSKSMRFSTNTPATMHAYPKESL